MTKFIQKISLRPYSETDIWTGWELEGSHGEIEGLINAEQMTPQQLAELGVTEFHRIPKEYLDRSGFRPWK